MVLCSFLRSSQHGMLKKQGEFVRLVPPDITQDGSVTSHYRLASSAKWEENTPHSQAAVTIRSDKLTTL